MPILGYSPRRIRLNDKTYAELLHRLAEKNFAGMSSELQADIEQFYANPAPPNDAKRNSKRWSQVQRELVQLKSWSVASNLGNATGVQ